jgi:predicted hydrocarbon binding protein
MAWKRSADKPVCHAQVGILQECLRWVSNGYEYYVVETACRATGSDSCVFSLNKTPIGQR